MAYISKAKINREYKQELEAVEIWKQEQKAKRKRIRDWCTLTSTAILQLVIVCTYHSFLWCVCFVCYV